MYTKEITLTGKDILRFFTKFPLGGNGCWEWQAGKIKDRGYGQFWLNGLNYRAPRVMWTILHGPIPDSILIYHSCDNPPCVNPTHLFLGTNSDNVLDRNRKGKFTHWSSAKSYCKHGHEFVEENIYWENGIHRKCRECRRIKNLAWYHRQRENRNA